MKHIPKNLSSKSFPNFIRNHASLKDGLPEKIFPKIGIKNSSTKFNLTDVPDIGDLISNYISTFTRDIHRELLSYRGPYNEPMRDEIVQSASKAKIHIDGGKIKVIAPKDMAISGVQGNGGNFFNWIKSIPSKVNPEYFPHGSHNAVNKACDESNKRIDLLQSSPNLKLSFSSSGQKGAWDISTMAMRGISSCQRWNNNYSKALIGSLADPNVGIIFLSNNIETEYGSKMLKRAVVRMVRNVITQMPTILIERIYPHNYDVASLDTIAFAIFANYIGKRTNYQYPIVYGQELLNKGTSHNYAIPVFPKLRLLQEFERSYRDSKVIYQPNIFPIE